MKITSLIRFFRMASKLPLKMSDLLEGWFIVNNSQRYCRINNGHLEVATDDKMQNIEYSIQISKIVEKIDSDNSEFDLLPENSPKLHIESNNMDEINKLKNAIFNESSFEFVKPKIPTITDFKLSKIIGEGYSGKVHLVRRKTDNKLFALKLIGKEKLSNAKSMQRMFAERDILVQNNFPFITKIYSAFETENYLVLALEYVGGGNLQHHLDKGTHFTKNQIKIYLAELVLTVEHLHKMGIVFRDLKPSNILISKDGNLKITDFGLSKNIIDTGKTKTMCGTHFYLSPEMLSGDFYGYSVDWWALGVIAFRLVCGRLPFSNPNLSKLYDRIMACSYRFPVNLETDAKDFISGLLKKDPNDRLSIEQIKTHKFFADIDWDKVLRKEYKLDFIPKGAEDDSAYNFDLSLFDKYHFSHIQKEYEKNYSRSASIPNLKMASGDKSYVRDFSFSSTTEDYITDSD